MLNLNKPLRVRLANRKAGKAYLNNAEPMGHGFNGEGAGRVPVVCTFADFPFRKVGTTPEIMGHRYGGYYTDSHCDGTATGIVYQIPARQGAEQFLAGYTLSDTGESVLYLDIHSDKEDAARVADSHAEHYATREREYQEGEDAKQRLAELKEDRKTLRAELKAARVAYKATRRELSARLASVKRKIKEAE